MDIMLLTQSCLFVMTFALMLLGCALFVNYATDLATKRAKRKTQRDRNTQHIELAELQLSQMDERIACMETQIDHLKKHLK